MPPRVPVPIPRTVVRRVPDTLPEDDPRNVDNLGRLVPLPGSEPEAVITAGLEGIPTQINRARRMLVEYPGDLRPADPARDMDALTAMQLGCARLLQGMLSHQLNVEALLDNEADVQSRNWKLTRLFFDHPRPEDDAEPYPSANIAAVGKRTYDRQSLSTVLLEDTLNVFGPGTVLRKLANVSTQLEVTVWHATKEERRGLQAAVERTFLVEPAQDAQGRRVVVKEHYDRVARYVLVDADYPMDTPQFAQASTWISKITLAADIDRVLLVVSPGTMQAPQTPLDI